MNRPKLKYTFKVGELVYWTDLDDDICSGYYTITKIKSENEEINDDTIIVIENNTSFNEVFPHEIRYKK